MRRCTTGTFGARPRKRCRANAIDGRRGGARVEDGPSRAVTLQTLVVRRATRLPGEGGHRGHVKGGQVTLACALGRAGLTHAKREGDKATPTGRLRILFGFYRPDRLRRPFSRVPLTPLPQNLGWCDDPRSPAYNRPGPLPMRDAHEVMWREDGLYDVVLVLDYNVYPRRAARGSAIFLHCAKGMGPGLRPTFGCVAIRSDDMRRLLLRLGRNSTVRVVS